MYDGEITINCHGRQRETRGLEAYLQQTRNIPCNTCDIGGYSHVVVCERYAKDRKRSTANKSKSYKVVEKERV